MGGRERWWGDSGVVNFWGGCYAKVIRLSAEAEPEIYATTRRFGTVLENVTMDPATRRLDLDDQRKTENTRGCYPLDFIPNASRTGMAGHPQNVVMLTADAFGVLPPLTRLTPPHALNTFLSCSPPRLPDPPRPAQDRKHARLLPARLHPERLAHGHGRASAERRHADGRRLRRAAAAEPPHARTGDVPLPVGLHGARRRHREGPGQRAAGDVLDLLRGALHAAPPLGLR